MNINANLINYLHICHRKLWLHANGITMEHTSDIVYEGKLIGEDTYPQRADKNQELGWRILKIHLTNFYNEKIVLPF
jgi:CRISPR-associated exonuclease Cas4